MGKRKWTLESTEILHTMWGNHPPKAIALYIKRKTSLAFTPEGVRQKAKREGLDYRDAQGDLTTSDAARELGISRDALMKALMREGIETYGNALARYIRLEDVPRLRALYKSPPEPTVDTHVAAQRLKLTPESVTFYIRSGKLKAYWFKRTWCVSAADLERFIWDLERRKSKSNVTNT